MDPQSIITQTCRDSVIPEQTIHSDRNNQTIKQRQPKTLLHQLIVQHQNNGSAHTKSASKNNEKSSHLSSNVTVNNNLPKIQCKSVTIDSFNQKKQRDNRFLSQFLCCFRLPQPCNFYQDTSLIRQNNYLCKSPQKYLLASGGKRNDKMCMVIDLDETLVHSSFKPINNADFIVPVEIDGSIHKVYVLKRPYVDEFLERMGKLYECILFTASLSKYADPVTNLLDKKNIFKARLFRDSCSYYRGNYVKVSCFIFMFANYHDIIDNYNKLFGFSIMVLTIS